MREPGLPTGVSLERRRQGLLPVLPATVPAENVWLERHLATDSAAPGTDSATLGTSYMREPGLPTGVSLERGTPGALPALRLAALRVAQSH